jgi:hypothetical protein
MAKTAIIIFARALQMQIAFVCCHPLTDCSMGTNALNMFTVPLSSGLQDFFLVQHTKTGKYIPNRHKIHIPNNHKVYQMIVK